jgi:hypothetical protein
MKTPTSTTEYLKMSDKDKIKLIKKPKNKLSNTSDSRIYCPNCKNLVDVNWGVGVENADSVDEKLIRYWSCKKCKNAGRALYILQSIEIWKVD